MVSDGLTPIGPHGPTPEQIEAARQGAVNWWACRYCGRGRVLIGQGIHVEADQAARHQEFCPSRPRGAKP